MTYEDSTYFIKGQLKDVSVEKLLRLYEEVLQGQNVSSLYTQGNTVYFTNGILGFLGNRFAKFSEFSEGAISIEENETDFLVFFEGKVRGVFIVPLVIALVPMLFFLIVSGFDLHALFVGPVLFLMLMIVKFFFVYVIFPVYFTSVRNDIELKYRNRSYGTR